MKDDLDAKVVDQSELEQFSKENGFIHCSFCSVKETRGIDEPMRLGERLGFGNVFHKLKTRELIKVMLNQEHTSGEVLQAFDRIEQEATGRNDSSKCCISMA